MQRKHRILTIHMHAYIGMKKNSYQTVDFFHPYKVTIYLGHFIIYYYILLGGGDVLLYTVSQKKTNSSSFINTEVSLFQMLLLEPQKLSVSFKRGSSTVLLKDALTCNSCSYAGGALERLRSLVYTKTSNMHL